MQKTTQAGNDAKKELEVYKKLTEYREKKCWKLDILNDNLYGWVFGLGTAFVVSFVCNLIQLAN